MIELKKAISSMIAISDEEADEFMLSKIIQEKGAVK